MPSTFDRLKQSRIVQAVGVYAASSWVVLEVVGTLRENLDLPRSVFVATLVLLAIGLLVVVATAWVQSRPGLAERASAEEVPEAWELDAGDLMRSLARGRLPHLTWARALVGGAAAFLLLFGFAGLYVVLKDRGESFFVRSAEASVAPGIAVMPFAVSGSDAEVWREGMMDLFSTNLDGVGGLRTIHTRTVLARWRERSLDESADLVQVLDAARATGARLALVGSAVAIGSEVRLRAELYDVERGTLVDEAGVEGPEGDMLSLIDRLSVDVVRRLLEEEQGQDAVRIRSLESLTTGSVPALRAYLEGEALYRRAEFAGATRAFQTAVAEDSLFAMAHYRLSASLGWGGGEPEVADVHRSRARELAHRLPHRDSVLISTSDRALSVGEARAIDDLQALSERYPDDPEVWYWLGEAYNHIGELGLVPVEDMGAAFERSIALDSAHVPAYIHAIESALSFHDMDKARALLAGFERYGQGVVDLDRMRFLVRFTENVDGLGPALAETTDQELYDLVINLDDAGIGTELLRDRLTEEMLRRVDAGRTSAFGERPALILRASSLNSRGKRGELQALLPRFDPVDGTVTVLEARTHALEVTVPEGLSPGLGFRETLYDAAVAAWDGDARRLDVRLEALRNWERPEGWTPEAFQTEIAPVLQGLEALARWQREGAAAAADLEAAHRATHRGGEGTRLSAFLAFAAMEALTELARYEEALPYARAFRANPFMTFRTAQLYEELGRDAEAERLYPLLEQAWNEAEEGAVPEVGRSGGSGEGAGGDP
ncbi:MAG TPA: hypothetical protein VK858_10895 [Longimicrobiales bacterium]|nr:hypothetical protein [Longimicrobiales bacterium]